jgi:hypothetical protein
MSQYDQTRGTLLAATLSWPNDFSLEKINNLDELEVGL